MWSEKELKISLCVCVFVFGCAVWPVGSVSWPGMEPAPPAWKHRVFYFLDRLIFILFYFIVYLTACGILVSWPRIKLGPWQWNLRSPNHWTAIDFPVPHSFYYCSFLLLSEVFQNTFKSQLKYCFCQEAFPNLPSPEKGPFCVAGALYFCAIVLV